MISKTAALKVAAGADASVLRLHEEEGPAIEAPRAGSLVCDDPRAIGVWGRVLEGFLNRAAARRLEHYAACHAGYRWKPSLALVLPAEFTTDRPAHLRDLAAALEVLAAVMDHYRVDVVSDSPDAAHLFRRVVPFSREAIAASSGALVLLSRSLNDEVGAIRPSRYVAADPCARPMGRKRIAFTAAGVDWNARPVEEHELASEIRGCAQVLIDDDEGVPSFLESLRRLQAAGLALCLTLSSRADDDFTGRIRAAFGDDPRVEVRDPEPCGFCQRPEFRISNDPIALLTRRASALPRYIFARGRFWMVGDELPGRSDLCLIRGEESNAHGLLDTWLGRGAPGWEPPRAPRPAGSTEPLVSIVVPVVDGTTEIIRLAHSIYVQDYPWLEVVFVCSGSPPETMEAVRASENYLMKRRYGVRVIELADGGGSTALPRDFGLRASSGDLVCWLDSRDWLDPGFFAFLRAGPWRDDTLYHPTRVDHDPGRAAGGDLCLDRAIGEAGALEADDPPAAWRRGNFRADSGVVFARSLFDRAGDIDDGMRADGILEPFRQAGRAGARVEDHSGCVHVSVEREDVGPCLERVRRVNNVLERSSGREQVRWP